MTEKIEDHTPNQAPMVSYVDARNPMGATYVQYKHEPLPPWAFNVRDIEEKKGPPVQTK